MKKNMMTMLFMCPKLVQTCIVLIFLICFCVLKIQAQNRCGTLGLNGAQDSIFENKAFRLDSIQLDTVSMLKQLLTSRLSKPEWVKPQSNIRYLTLNVTANYTQGASFSIPQGTFQRYDIKGGVTLFNKLPLDVSLSLLYRSDSFHQGFRPIANVAFDQEEAKNLAGINRYKELLNQISSSSVVDDLSQVYQFDNWANSLGTQTQLGRLDALEGEIATNRYQNFRNPTDSLVKQIENECITAQPLYKLKSQYDSLHQVYQNQLNQLDNLAAKADSVSSYDQNDLLGYVSDTLQQLRSIVGKVRFSENLNKLKLGMFGMSGKSLLVGNVPMQGLSFKYSKKGLSTQASIGLVQQWRNQFFDFDELTNSFGSQRMLAQVGLQYNQEQGYTRIDLVASNRSMDSTMTFWNLSEQGVSISTKQRVLKNLFVDGDFAYKLSGTPINENIRSSTMLPSALQVNLDYRINDKLGFKAGYKEVSPIFESAANPFLVANQRRFTLSGKASLIRKRLVINGGWTPTKPVETDLLVTPSISMTQWNLDMVGVLDKNGSNISFQYHPIAVNMSNGRTNQAQEFAVLSLMSTVNLRKDTKDAFLSLGLSNFRNAVASVDTSFLNNGMFANFNMQYSLKENRMLLKGSGFYNFPVSSNFHNKEKYFFTSMIINSNKSRNFEIGIDYIDIALINTPLVGCLGKVNFTVLKKVDFTTQVRYRVDFLNDKHNEFQIQSGLKYHIISKKIQK